MKYVKMLGLAAVAAMALTAFAASTASATTLEVNGSTQNASVSLSASLETGTSAVLSRTDGSLANTCTTSSVAGATSSPYTGEQVTGAVSTLTFANCSETVTVDNAGQLYIKHIVVEEKPTTNGTVYSENAEVTVKTPFGNEVNCKTGTGTDIGTLKGVSSGRATMEINAVLNCGFLLPSATWKGAYTISDAEGNALALGVSA